MNSTKKSGQFLRCLLVVPAVAERTGGIAMVGRSLMRLLARKHDEGIVDFRVISLDRTGDEQEAQRIRGWVGNRLVCFQRQRIRFSLATLWTMVTWAQVVVFTHVRLASLLSLLPRPLRPRSVVFIHGIEVWRPVAGRRRSGLTRSDQVVSNSIFTAQEARRYNPWFPETHSCPLGLPEENSNSCHTPPGTEEIEVRARDILMVGRMARGEGRKGHAELIEAMPEVVARVPTARLLIAGGGDDLERYRALAHASAARAHIVFTGFVERDILRSLHERSAVFAMPSRQEGFGLVYLEAMKAGKPCLASYRDAAAEVVVDGETGFLVDPENRQQIAASLCRLLLDDPLRERFGRQGRERFLAHFTESDFHARFWQVIESLIGNKQPQLISF